jgi:integrase/recombinase XerD
VMGKGRKERSLPIWKQAAADLRGWIAVRGDVPTPELFVNARGEPMTRAGFTYVLDKYTSKLLHSVARHFARSKCHHMC